MSNGDEATTLLDIRDLSVHYGSGENTVLAGIKLNLKLRKGEIVALVGESGSGKSTLSKAIIGLLPEAATVSDGAISLAGENLLGLSQKQLESIRGCRIGMIPQDPGASLDPVKTIGSQVSEVFRLHRQGPKRSKAELRSESIRLLAMVGVDRPEYRLGQYPHELSGGLKQRVLIAIAFALGPELLIAD